MHTQVLDLPHRADPLGLHAAAGTSGRREEAQPCRRTSSTKGQGAQGAGLVWGEAGR
jgi:hypothetical protein